ncbi:MAG: MFS transporter [Myxococcota bacterium]|nr:MFS transporter [Myxococcota bacterium]
MSVSTKFFYGIGSVAYGVKDNGFAFFLLLYYNQVLGLSAQLTSLALFVALIVDAISDPVVGTISDRFHSKFGRRHPFMYASILPVSVGYFFLWNPPDLSETGLFLYLLGFAVVIRTFITFYEVPSTALAPELTEDYDERTSLAAVRFFFGWVGGILLSMYAYLVLLTPTAAQPVGQLNEAGYQTYGLIGASMMALTILCSSLGTHRHIPNLKVPPPKRRRSLGETISEIRESFDDPSFRALFGYAIFASMSAGLVSAMNIYLNTYFWELRAGQIGYLVPAGLVSAVLALKLAPALAGRIGKKRAAIRLSIAAALFAPVPYTAGLMEWAPAKGSNELVYFLIVYSVIEIGLIIASTTLVSAMMADVVEASELKTGRRSEGIFFAARSFLSKSLSATGLLLATTLLWLVDFPDEAKPGQVDPQVIRNLVLGYMPSTASLYLISVACLFGYKITREDHSANLEALRDRGSS